MDVMAEVPNLSIGMIQLPLVWERWSVARALLHPALMASDEDWPAVEAQLAAEHAQLWAVISDDQLLAATITRKVAARGGDVVEIFLVGGTGFRAWIGPLNQAIAAAAQVEGCTGMRAYGRPGWRDALASLGWRQSFVGYEASFPAATIGG